MSSPCSAALLEQFLNGSLSSPDEAALRGHLSCCDFCCQWLESHSDNPQLRTWGKELARLKEHTLQAPALERMLEALRLGYADSTLRQRRPSSVLPFLEPPSVAGDLGQLGPYRIQAELGRGGMGIVYRGLDGELGRVVAIKVLRPEVSDEEAQARLVREARLAARFRHEHVVGVHAVALPPGGLPYVVLEYVDGQPLSKLLRQRHRLEPAEAVNLLRQVADALVAAHAGGLVHRDVKPSNILIEHATGLARLTDFGLARAETQTDTLTSDGALLGTPVYMSPEQARAQPADGRTDVYGLGVTLYEMLTGEVPFHGTPLMIVRQVLQDEPRPPRRLHEGIPRDLETICLKAMHKEPGRRYPTAAALREDLRRWQAGEPIHARPAGPMERLIRWGRRRPLAAALLLTILVGVGGITWKGAEAVQLRHRAEAERDEAARQRGRAEQNLHQALAAVDAYLTRVSDNPTLRAGGFESLRHDLLQTARDFYEQFVTQEPENDDLRAELGRAHGRLGLITATLASRPVALGHYQKMRAIFEELCRDHPEDLPYQDELAESYLQEGLCYRVMSQLAAAREDFARCRALRTALVQAHPDVAAYRLGLARLLLVLGNLQVLATNEYGDAQQTLAQARQLYVGLPTGPDAPAEYRVGLARTLLLLGMLHGLIDQPGPQADSCRQAIRLFESLAHSYPEEPDYGYNAANTLSELGFACLRLKQTDAAEKAWRRQLQLARHLSQQHPDCARYQCLMADAHYNLAGLLFHRRGQHAAARVELQRMLDLQQRITLAHPSVSEYQFCLYNALRDFRNWYGDLGPHRALLNSLDDQIRQVQTAATQAAARLRSLRQLQTDLRVMLAQYEGSALPAGLTPQTRAAYEAALKALERTEALARELPGNGSRAYDVALSLARAAAAAQRAALPAAVVDAHAARAIGWLAKAQALHYFSAFTTCYLLDDERQLNCLRNRADFRRLLAQAKP